MTWLAPLGFLGLIGIVALIIIYVIKPNYQKKMVSSTFVWKLSLKYRKKRLPVSQLNNVLIFLCQLIILTICGLLLARPVIEAAKAGDENEKVIIIDASASMRVNDGGRTRFERAVSEARLLAEQTIGDGGVVSVILADTDPEYIVQRTGADKLDYVLASIDALLEDGDKCTYSSADMSAAVALTEEVLRYNYEAQVFLYTGTEYLVKNGINVVDVSKDTEWNAAILDCTAELDESHNYNITVNVGCYNRTEGIIVYCEIHGVNGTDAKVPLQRLEYFDPTSEEISVVFSADDIKAVYGKGVSKFESVEVYVAVEDSFPDDNSFFLYGGEKPVINIQYASSMPNNYFSGIIHTLRQMMRDKWEIRLTELKADETPKTEGFDFYIFEHGKMPATMPTDGVVLLVNPTKEPEGAGFTLGGTRDITAIDSANAIYPTLAFGVTHDLTKFVDFSRINVSKYTEIVTHDGYAELAYYQGSPVMLAKNDGSSKVVIWAFDLNRSTLPVLPDFPFLLYNLFNYYIPSTLTSNTFEIGDTVDLAARGSNLTVKGNGLEYVMEGTKGSVTVVNPGVYTVTQTPMSADPNDPLIMDNFYVRIPMDESKLTRQVDSLPVADVDVETRIDFEDLMFYFAIALVSFLFVEWILQIKKNF